MTDWTPIILALISGPVVAYLMNRQARLLKQQEFEQRRIEKAEDYKRQDEVAERLTRATNAARARVDEVATEAAGAAEKLKEQQVETARLLKESDKKFVHTSEITNTKLDAIHELGNSTLTAQMSAHLTALRGQLVLMKRVAELNVELHGGGVVPGKQEEDAIIKAAEAQVADLQATVAERLRQQAQQDEEKAKNGQS